jgi:hypothetical protein
LLIRILLFLIVDLKEQLLGWSTPISADENYDESDDNRTSQQPESATEEPSQSVPKRLADLRNQLSNKQYALTAAKEGSIFDATVCIHHRCVLF